MSQPPNRLQDVSSAGGGGSEARPAPLRHRMCAPVRISLGNRFDAVVSEQGDLYISDKSTWRRERGLQRCVGAVPPRAARDVACGAHHFLVSLADGRVFAGGANRCWQCDRNPAEWTRLAPVAGISNAVRVFAGERFSFVLCTGGDVYSFGENMSGQLCRGFVSDKEPPQLAAHLCRKGVLEISAGLRHALALLADGGVLAWGWIRGRKVDGDGLWSRELGSCPIPISFGGGRLRAVSVSAGELHCAVATDDGRLWLWGDGNDGRLGFGDENHVKAPKALDLPGGGHAVKVQCSSACTYATSSSGRVFMCGLGGLYFTEDPHVPDFHSWFKLGRAVSWEAEDDDGTVDRSLWTSSVAGAVSLRRRLPGGVLRVGTESFAENAFHTPLSDIGVAAESSVHLLRLPCITAMSNAEAVPEGPLQVYVNAAALGAETPLCLELRPEATVGDVVRAAVGLLRCTTE
eukprot:TRINITY_DN14163_c0_g2_i1.p1 TRINITY_DN14163_c0_g2~~TRINITY_DN14163_c0_g2_i1.p1  ORF type:complete len:494 (+),score=66.35 TRINITY_DN14163_c0_g2_i1:102-1484(+)